MKTKDKILSSAITLFAEKGYIGSSVRDICNHAEVSMSAINYHFEGKEKLLQAIFDIYTENSLEQIVSLINEFDSYENLKSQMEMLTLLILNKNMENLDLYKIVYREVDNRNPIAIELVENKVSLLYKTLLKEFKKAKRKKILKKDVDCEILVSLYLNTIDSKIRTDFIDKSLFNTSLQDIPYRKKWVKQIIKILF